MGKQGGSHISAQSGTSNIPSELGLVVRNTAEGFPLDIYRTDMEYRDRLVWRERGGVGRGRQVRLFYVDQPSQYRQKECTLNPFRTAVPFWGQTT